MAEVVLRSPGLLMVLALLAAGCGGGGDRAEAPERGTARDLVLITIDTWRGDHFDSERADTPLTPALAAFADGGVRFTEAASAASETSPGTAAILTGLMPRRAGVLINAHLLQEGVPTLATLLAGEGFVSAAVVANPVLRPGVGFERGFDGYELVPSGSAPKALGSDVTDAALAAFDALPAGDGGERPRRFLWVHYLDPHGPYLPPEETARLFPAESFAAPRDIPFGNNDTGRMAIPIYQRRDVEGASHDGRGYMARYAAEVRSVDGEAGRLLDELAIRGALDDAVVVITADHGEALAGDHGYYFSHNNGVSQDQVHVPLVVRCPGCSAGVAVTEPVSTIDVVPTVLARLGVEPPGAFALDGRDLFGGARGGDRPPEAYSERGSEVALRRGDWKLVWKRGSAPQLYHLGRDPGERRNVAKRRGRRLEEMLAALRELRARPVLVRPTKREALSPGERDQLRSLGYL